MILGCEKSALQVQFLQCHRKKEITTAHFSHAQYGQVMSCTLLHLYYPQLVQVEEIRSHTMQNKERLSRRSRDDFGGHDHHHEAEEVGISLPWRGGAPIISDRRGGEHP